MEEKKKGKVVLVVIIILLLLICCGMGAFIFMNKDVFLEKKTKEPAKAEEKKDKENSNYAFRKVTEE